jgi:PDZ domain-containing secreted protein
MKLERRVPLPWLIAGALVSCLWCSFLSGLGGWIMGRDLTAREQHALYETAVAARADLPQLGVLVTRLDRTGPAQRVGIARGDMITAFNGAHLEDARDLRSHLDDAHPGDSVRLTVLRERGEEDIMLRLGSFPDDVQRPYLGIYYTARGDDPADL